MITLRKHSLLNIRNFDNVSMGTVDLPNGLQIDVGDLEDTNTLHSGIRAGRYGISERLYGFVKERGEYALNATVFHFESISLRMNGDPLIPLIFRCWTNSEEMGFRSAEFLVSNSLLMFRNIFLGTPPVRDTLLMQFASHLYDQSFRYGDISSAMIHVIGWNENTSDMSFLIPNLNHHEYNNVFVSLEIRRDLNWSLQYMLNLFYQQEISPDDIIQLIGYISGNIPAITLDQYNHPGIEIFNDAEVFSSVSTIQQYAGLLTLAKIPYDLFTIKIDLQCGTHIDIMKLDTMAGPHFPFMYHEIDEGIRMFCYEFLFYFFTNHIENNKVHYVDTVHGQPYRVDSVTLQKTMDEYLTIHIHSGDIHYEYVYDMIMISLLSPSVS